MLHRADNEQVAKLKSTERQHNVKSSKVEIFYEQKKQKQLDTQTKVITKLSASKSFRLWQKKCTMVVLVVVFGSATF